MLWNNFFWYRYYSLHQTGTPCDAARPQLVWWEPEKQPILHLFEDDTDFEDNKAGADSNDGPEKDDLDIDFDCLILDESLFNFK